MVGAMAMEATQGVVLQSCMSMWRMPGKKHLWPNVKHHGLPWLSRSRVSEYDRVRHRCVQDGTSFTCSALEMSKNSNALRLRFGASLYPSFPGELSEIFCICGLIRFFFRWCWMCFWQLLGFYGSMILSDIFKERGGRAYIHSFSLPLNGRLAGKEVDPCVWEYWNGHVLGQGFTEGIYSTQGDGPPLHLDRSCACDS